MGESITVIPVESICNAVLFSCSSPQIYVSATFPVLVNAANEITLSATVDMLRQHAAHVLNVTLHHPPPFLLT